MKKFKVKVKPKSSNFDMTGSIIAYEQGKLGEKDTIRLFQHLEDTGLAYRLQGHYGRVATAMIGSGLIKPNMKYHTAESIKRYKMQQQLNEAFG